MEEDYSKIGPTAFGQVYLKSFCGIPYAKEICDITKATENYGDFWHLNDQGKKEVALFTETRYKGTELVIRKYIKEQNIKQIVELACGLSPQGIILSQDFPDIKYLETDLPEMIEAKKKVLKDLHKENIKNIYFSTANALNLEELEKALGIFDKDKKVIITATGFLSYLNIDEKRLLAENVKKILSVYGGFFISPDLSGHNERRKGMYTKGSSQKIFEKKIKEATSRGYQENAFKNEEETEKFYKGLGFKIEKFPQLQGYELFSAKNFNFDKKDFEAILENIKKFGKVWVFSLI